MSSLYILDKMPYWIYCFADIFSHSLVAFLLVDSSLCYAEAF